MARFGFISKSIDFVVVVISVPVGFLIFLANNLEKRDLSDEDCESGLDWGRTC